MSLTDAQVAEVLPLRFDVPEQFTGIDLAEDSEQRAERTLRQVEQGLPETTAEQRLHLLLAQQYIIDRMVQEGTVYAATLVAVSDEIPDAAPKLSILQFAVSVHQLDGGVGSQTLEAMAAGMRDEDLRRDVGFVQLPAGRALAVVEDRELATPVNLLGDPTDDVHLFRQLQLILPFPDGRRVAAFALCTESLQDWDSYVDIMGGIARTIEFTTPGLESPGDDPGDVPSGDTLRHVLGGL